MREETFIKDMLTHIEVEVGGKKSLGYSGT